MIGGDGGGGAVGAVAAGLGDKSVVADGTDPFDVVRVKILMLRAVGPGEPFL